MSNYFLELLKIIKNNTSIKELMFLKSLGITSIGVFFSGIFSMVASFFIARTLGPAKFGLYSIVLGLAQFLMLFMTLGIQTAITHYLPASKNKNATASTGLAILAVNITFISILLLLCATPLSNLIKLPIPLTIVGILLASALSLRYAADAIIRGFMKFRLSTIFEIVATLASFILIMFFIFRGIKNPVFYLSAIATAAIVYCILTLIAHFDNLGISNIFKVDAKEMLAYGGYASFISAAQIVLMQADKIILNMNVSAIDVGIYAVYVSSSLLITSFAFTITNYVLLPTFSENKSIGSILNRFKQYIPFVLTGTFITALIIGFVYMHLLGPKYPFGWLRLIIASAYSALYFLANIITVIGFSRGKKELLFISKTMVFIALFFVLIAFPLSKFFGITGMLSALAMIYLLIVILLYRRLNKAYN